jgi:hypothetical protein
VSNTLFCLFYDSTRKDQELISILIALIELSPRGEICSLGGMFTPSGKHSLLLRRMEGQTENFTPGDNFTPRGQNSPLGDKFAPGGKVCP